MIISNKDLYLAPKDEIIDKEYEEINQEISKVLLNMNEEKEPNFNLNFIQKDNDEIKNKNENNSFFDNSIDSKETKYSINSSKTISHFPQSKYDSNVNSIYYQNVNFINQNDNIINKNNTFVNNCNFKFNFNQNNFFSPNTKYEKNNLFSYSKLIPKSHKRNLDNIENPKNIIHLDNILKLKDKRTTLIIRNIPNKYNLLLLIEELNINFSLKYDILYLPLDYINNSNLGFGFINFIDPIHIIYFYNEFFNKKWNFINSGKRCQIAYSKIQGRKEFIKYINKKLDISINSNFNYDVYNNFYIYNNNYFILNNPEKIKQEIEIPINYYSPFLNYYPYSSCHQKNEKVFVVDKYYNI